MDVRGQVSTWARLSALGMVLSAAGVAQAEGFTQDQVDQGLALYNRTCVHCHGRNMVNSGTTVYDLRRFPQDDKERFVDSVTHGKGNMPSWKGKISPAEIDLLWAYVATRGGKEL